MAVYVMYRAFTTLVILPFAAGLFSPEWTRSVFLVLIAIGATILSFTRYKGIAASLAIILGLLALGSWARIIFRWHPCGPGHTWSGAFCLSFVSVSQDSANGGFVHT